MYLEYEEYKQMGGTLDSSAFSILERRAEYAVNSQAAGQTGERINELAELPQAVKDCIFDLIALFSVNAPGDKQVSSESQSQGGRSESISYVTKTNEEITAQSVDIIEQYFYGGGIGELLYRGVNM